MSLNISQKLLDFSRSLADNTMNKPIPASSPNDFLDSNPLIKMSGDIENIMKSSTWGVHINTDNSSLYGKEIDIYAIVNNIFENKNDNNTDNENDNDETFNIYDTIEKYRQEYEPNINITSLSVSAQSAKARMTMSFDLQKLSEIISKKIKSNKKFPILGIFYKNIHEGIIKKPKPRKKGAFPNNMAILIKSPMGTDKIIHMKIFKNGSISMVGCKIKEDGIAVIRILETFILKQNNLFNNLHEKSNFKITDFETTMVNSNYSIGFKIDRDRLFHFLQKKYNNLFSSYDPAVYAAVKIGFYYNNVKEKQNGVCTCSIGSCNLKKSTAGKGTGNGEGKCKKVTIAIFESGNIVITGGRNIIQAKEAYIFINNIIKENYKEISLINLSDIYTNK